MTGHREAQEKREVVKPAADTSANYVEIPTKSTAPPPPFSLTWPGLPLASGSNIPTVSSLSTGKAQRGSTKTCVWMVLSRLRVCSSCLVDTTSYGAGGLTKSLPRVEVQKELQQYSHVTEPKTDLVTVFLFLLTYIDVCSVCRE